jgi:hypothetical protein
MLVFAFEYQEAIDKFTGSRANNIWQLEIRDSEWDVIEQLKDILEVCCCVICGFVQSSHFQILKHRTLFFSRETLNLANVIPVIDRINDLLTAKAND